MYQVFSPTTTYNAGLGTDRPLDVAQALSFLERIDQLTYKVGLGKLIPSTSDIRLEDGRLMLGETGITKEGAQMLCPSAIAMARRADDPRAYVDALQFAHRYGLIQEDAQAVVMRNPNEDGRPNKIEAFQRNTYGSITNHAAFNMAGMELAGKGMALKRLQLVGRKMLAEYQQRDEKSIEIAVGDVVGAGVSVLNSEDGTAAFSMQAMLLRLACSNGMVLPRNFFDVRAIHRKNVLSTIRTKLDRVGGLDLGGVIDLVRNSTSKVWEPARHNPLFAEAYGLADPRPMLEAAKVDTVFKGWNLINDFKTLQGAGVEVRRQREASSYTFLDKAMA